MICVIKVNTNFGGTPLAQVACRYRGLTILELLVAVTILSFLLTILLPAIQAAREATRNTHCMSNLHQIGVALHAYHDAHRAFPVGWQPEATHKSSYGWAAAILREIEEPALYLQINHKCPIDTVSDAVRSTTPSVFLCPSDPGELVFPLYAEIGDHDVQSQVSTQILVTLPRANYMGVFGTTDPDDVLGTSGDGLFIQCQGRRMGEVSRGLSHVVSVGERTARKLASTWLGIATQGEDAAGRIVGYNDVGPNRDNADECEFDSRHPGHANFTWADGHVASIHDDVDRKIYRQLAQRR